MTRTLTCVLFVLAFLAVGCTAEVPTVDVTGGGTPAGFWLGLWHGLISTIAFVVSLFDPSVAIYEVNNTGAWYDLGFLIGAGGTTSSGTSAVRRVRTRRSQAA